MGHTTNKLIMRRSDRHIKRHKKSEIRGGDVGKHLKDRKMTFYKNVKRKTWIVFNIQVFGW